MDKIQMDKTPTFLSIFWKNKWIKKTYALGSRKALLKFRQAWLAMRVLIFHDIRIFNNTANFPTPHIHV